jgi:hypothetical protein
MIDVVLLATALSAAQTLSTPRPKADGIPAKLAWSRDDAQLYVAIAATGARDATIVNQFIVALPSGEISPVEGQPGWVADYWNWKSDRRSQHWLDLQIDVKVTKEKGEQVGPAMTRDALSTGTQSDPTGATVVATVAHGENKVDVYRLLLKDQVVTTSVGAPPNPGVSFSWVPGGDGPVMVYVNDKGKLSALEQSGHHRDLKDTDKATLPAVSWSKARLAFLQQTGKHNWSLRVIDLTP